MGKLVQHHVLHAPHRCRQQPQIKRQYATGRAAVAPLGNHMPEPDLRKCHTFRFKHGINCTAEIPHCLFAGVFPPAVEYLFPNLFVFRLFHQQPERFPLHQHAFPTAAFHRQPTGFPQIQYWFSGGIVHRILFRLFCGSGVLVQGLENFRGMLL